jgi:hypothetical protein
MATYMMVSVGFVNNMDMEHLILLMALNLQANLMMVNNAGKEN